MGCLATQHFKRNLLLNLYREEKISLVCFLLPLKRDKNVWHLQPLSSFGDPWPSCLLPSHYFPGNSTEVACHFLLQGIFWTQGLNLCLLYHKWALYLLRHWGSSPGLYNCKYFTLVFFLSSLFSISVRLFLCNIPRLDLRSKNLKKKTMHYYCMWTYNLILLII